MATESKQIDGVVDDPENGGLKSGPCLIAGFHALSCTSPSYYNPYRGVNKNTLSVDMVRLSLTFKGDRGEWLSRKGAQLTDCDEMSAWTSKIRPGGWYELWSFALGGSSVALGIGFMEPSCKVNMHKGFIEFNPNKVAGDKRFHGLLKTLGTCVSKARLKRFDLAYDILVKCDGLASRIRAGVAGIRIKVEELRSRISRPLEYLMRREQPRQQSLNDVLRDAQRAADAWNRDHAAPQRTHRGRAR